MRRCWLLALPLLLCAAEDRDATVLLERRCYQCHNAKLKSGGLDLSVAERRPLSLMLARVMKGEMPPMAPLPASDRETLRAWIEPNLKRAGADWWSLQPLRPYGGSIDQWIQAKLRDAGLEPAPPADRRTLIRRATFDLLGLPPSPEEVQAFVSDPDPNAYPRLVDRLLASPHYGERWARHWLDVVRFSESEGFERDLMRDHAWHYRDYVIGSFNNDKSYLQFAREQLAGDVLEPVTHDGIIATALLALGPIDAVGLTSAIPQERATIREDQLEEMMGVIGQTFLGMTVNCARCLDHKFDPIPQRDYYRMKSAFDNVFQTTRDESVSGLDELFPHGRPLLTPSEEASLNARRDPLQDRIEFIQAELGRLYRAARPVGQASRPVSAVPAPIARWTFDTDARDEVGTMHANLPAKVELRDGALAGQSGNVVIATEAIGRTVRAKTIEAWIRVASLSDRAVAVFELRNRSGYRGASVDGIQYMGGKTRQWENGSVGRFRSREMNAPPEDTPADGRLQIAIAYDEDGAIRMYRNGKPYGEPYQPDASTAAGRLQTFHPQDAVARFTVSKEFHLEEARLYDRALSGEQLAALFQAGVDNATPASLESRMTAVDRDRLRTLDQELASKKKELSSLPSPPLVFSASPRQPGPSYVLLRGDVTRPGEAVTAGGLSNIRGFDADLGLDAAATGAERRRRMAGWIANPSNPLFARTIVNRVWHYHFGNGLVENPNDLGFNGGTPSHPELLDHLAAGFIRDGWSLKRLHKRILLSHAYRQSSAFHQAAAAKDAGNRLLWRFAPQRLSAEAVRDAMLETSGALNASIHGPSFRPFELSKTGSYQNYKPVDSDEPQFRRRTIYRMNVNSGGHPMLDALDCPVPSIKTPKRPVTTTPLQALSLMNSGLVQQQAKAFALRLEREAGAASTRVDRGFRLALGRAPSSDEMRWSVDLVQQHGLEAFCWGLFNASEFLYVE